MWILLPELIYLLKQGKVFEISLIKFFEIKDVVFQKSPKMDNFICFIISTLNKMFLSHIKKDHINNNYHFEGK